MIAFAVTFWGEDRNKMHCWKHAWTKSWKYKLSISTPKHQFECGEIRLAFPSIGFAFCRGEVTESLTPGTQLNRQQIICLAARGEECSKEMLFRTQYDT